MNSPIQSRLCVPLPAGDDMRAGEQVIDCGVLTDRLAPTSRCLRWIAAGLLIAALGGCEQPKKFKAVDISGVPYAQSLALRDHNGTVRTLANFRGKLVVVFFGFTQCPDVCPTTLSDMVEVKKRLGPDGEKIEVLFITVDPERDTPALLAQYVPGFDPAFLGLTGTPQEIAATANEFKVFYQKAAGTTPTSYTMDHTAASYVFDKDGKIRLYIRYGTPVDDVVADLKKLL